MRTPTSYVCLSGRSRSQCTLRRLSRWLTQARTQESLHLELYTVSISQLVLKLLGRTWVYNLWWDTCDSPRQPCVSTMVLHPFVPFLFRLISLRSTFLPCRRFHLSGLWSSKGDCPCSARLRYAVGEESSISTCEKPLQLRTKVSNGYTVSFQSVLKLYSFLFLFVSKLERRFS